MAKQPKVVGGINFSTRSKSPSFWLGTIASVGTFIVSMGGLLGVDGLEDIVNQGSAIAGVIISILTQLGVLVDHNTKGIKDSEIVKTDYKKPRDSQDPAQAVGFIDEGSSPMAPDEVGEKDIEEQFDDAEPEEALDSETPDDDVPDEEKTSSPRG